MRKHLLGVSAIALLTARLLHLHKKQAAGMKAAARAADLRRQRPVRSLRAVAMPCRAQVARRRRSPARRACVTVADLVKAPHEGR